VLEPSDLEVTAVDLQMHLDLVVCVFGVVVDVDPRGDSGGNIGFSGDGGEINMLFD